MGYLAARAGLAILGAVIAAALGWLSLRVIGLRPAVLVLWVFWLVSVNAVVGWLLRPRSQYAVIECLLFSPGSWLFAVVIGVSWFDPPADSTGALALVVVAISWLAALGGYWLWKVRHKPAENVCRACGYNLTGNVSGRCPECGTPIPGGRRAASGGPRFGQKT